MARPSAYKEEYCKQAYRMSLLGLTDVQMAEVFNISEVTLNAWKKKYPELLKSIKKGKRPADAKVAASLFKRACGFTKKQVKIFSYLGGTFEHEYLEYYPPDVAAAFIWLKNRQQELWKDRKEIGVDPTIDWKDVASAIRKSDTSKS